MNDISIERTLWYEADQRVYILQRDLDSRTEPLVILGEAGMGKSHILERLAQTHGYAKCTARALINRFDPRTLLGDAKVLVIDAVDEVAGQRDGDAVDLVLRRLGQLHYPRFILSCRVADWRSATAIEAIREQYPDMPLELHLMPFTDADAFSFLSAMLGAERTDEVLSHFNSQGLHGLLGNPQTLELVARVAGGDTLPSNRAEIFEGAVEVLRVEHRQTKIDAQPPRESALDAAGAAFAGLILSGNGAIVRGALANNDEGELQLSEIGALPGAHDIEAILGTRLFRAEGAGRFSYWHRRIGEFLGAKWLARQANSKRKRRRLLHLFHSHGLVPASLRGLHAWLATDAKLAPAVIAADPMGIIEYGDADGLTPEQGRTLLRALELLAEENPDFRRWWGPLSLRGVAQPALVEDLRTLAMAENSFGLRLLILEAIKGSSIAHSFAADLNALVVDAGEGFAIRSAAAEALIQGALVQDWDAIVRTLHVLGDSTSVRLALKIVGDVGFETFDDILIVDLVFSYANDSSPVVGVLRGLKLNLPADRLDGILDGVRNRVPPLDKNDERLGNAVLTEFVYHLVTRQVRNGIVDAKRLWSWLLPFRRNEGYTDEVRKDLATLLEQRVELRREVQRLVLLENDDSHSSWSQVLQLRDRSTGFTPTPDDLVVLLEQIDSSDHDDKLWRELVQLSVHDANNGSQIRSAALRFAAHRPDVVQWLEGLSEERIPMWQMEQTKRDQERKEKRAREQAKSREYFAAHIENTRRGELEFVLNPARCYLSLFSDMDNEDMPAHERVLHWLGTEIGSAALTGFDAFIALEPPVPTADEIVASQVEGMHWNAGHVIVAALAERLRNTKGFADLADERLFAGLFELRHTKIDAHAKIEGLELAIESEVKARGRWPNAMRQYHEPQLAARREHVDGLAELMRDEAGAMLAVVLSAEWLMRFQDIPTAPEVELIERLVRSDEYRELRKLVPTRLAITDIERRRNWDAVGLLADFDATICRLDAATIQPEFLWHIRSISGFDHRGHEGVALSVVQLEWIIKSFRSLWPVVPHPSGGWSGTTNPFDAAEYLTRLIRRLGNTSDSAAMEAVARLRAAAADSYTGTIRAVAAEQAQLRVEATFVPPSLAAIKAVARDESPVSGSDFQGFILEELAVVQAKIRSDDVESWRGFYDIAGDPLDEERCRDHLIGLLRQGASEITFEPESHVSGGKKVDITCSVANFRIPIEIKGQWHRDLWHAADSQLDALYTPDWRAENSGIYVVLWFGDQKLLNKRLSSRSRGSEGPCSPSRLNEILNQMSRAAIGGRVSVFVLDLSRPSMPPSSRIS